MSTRILACLLMLLPAACGGGSLEPRPIRLDRDECARCGMLVSSEKDAAESVSPNQDPRVYDDRGCLAKDAGALPPGARLYVQLDGGGGWIEANQASFAFTSTQTPMGYNVTAFRTADEARRADRDGRARPWSAVVEQLGK